jgi:GNAT superfamily N-acetyltransferase
MIQRVHYKEILKNKEILAEYAKDCLVDGYEPQEKIYEAMDKAGMLYCMGAYIEGELVGFASLVVSIMPHNGKKIAAIESIFALPEYRKYGIGFHLVRAARDEAKKLGCEWIVYLPRIGSAFDKILENMDSCIKTHVQYTERL